MRILLVSEGNHELGADDEGSPLSVFVKRLLTRSVDITMEKVSSHKVRTHRMPGNSLDVESKSLNYKKRALMWLWYAEKEGFDALVFVIDEDGQSERRKGIGKAQENTTFQTKRAMGVAIRSFDAWMLADEQALTKVLRSGVSRQKDPEKMRDPKSVCAKLLENSTADMSQTSMYLAVANTADLAMLEKRCHRGFGDFAGRVRGL